MSKVLAGCERLFQKLVDSIGFKAPDLVFQDLLDLTLYFISGGKCMAKRIEALKTEYSEAKIKHFDSVFMGLVDLSVDFTDAFGTLYESITYQGKSQLLGQFFTPEPLSKCLANMIMGDTIAANPNDGKTSLVIADVSGCGSGRNLLSAAELVADYRWRHFFLGVDIDIICAKVTAINCFLHSLPAWIFHGNALTFDFKTCYQISVFPDAQGNWRPYFEELSQADTKLAMLAVAGKDPKTGEVAKIMRVEPMNERRVKMIEQIQQQEEEKRRRKQAEFMDIFTKLQNDMPAIEKEDETEQIEPTANKISVALPPNLAQIAKKIKNNSNTPPNQQTLF